MRQASPAKSSTPPATDSFWPVGTASPNFTHLFSRAPGEGRTAPAALVDRVTGKSESGRRICATPGPRASPEMLFRSNRSPRQHPVLQHPTPEWLPPRPSPRCHTSRADNPFRHKSSTTIADCSNQDEPRSPVRSLPSCAGETNRRGFHFFGRFSDVRPTRSSPRTPSDWLPMLSL